MQSAEVRRAKALRNNKKRRDPDGPEFWDLDRRYRQLSVAERVEQLLADAPPFTPEQIGRLTVLLAGRGVAA